MIKLLRLAIFAAALIGAPAAAQAPGPMLPVPPQLTPAQQEAPYLLYDDFTRGAQGFIDVTNRAPMVGNGAWVEKSLATSGPSTPPGTSEVTAAGLTSSLPYASQAAAFLVQQLPATPGEIGFTFTLADNTNTYNPTAGSWNGGQVTSSGNGELHIQIGNGSVATELVTGTSMYRGGGIGHVVPTWNDGSSPFQTYVFTPGVTYTFRTFFLGDWSYSVLLDANGDVLAKSMQVCAGVSGFTGPWFYLETFNQNLVYKQVWARAQTSPTVSIEKYLGGIDSTPIGMRDPAEGRFASAFIGNAPNTTAAGSFGISGVIPPGVYTDAGNDAVWAVQGWGAGMGGDLWLGNAINTYAIIRQDNSSGFHVIDESASNLDWLGKPSGTPSTTPADTIYMAKLPGPYANDAAAATAGVPVGGLYVDSSTNVHQRQS